MRVRGRAVAAALVLAAGWATALAARVDDSFKAEFDRQLGPGRHAILAQPLPASSAEGEPGYRHDYYSVEVRDGALGKAGTWSAQYLDAEIPAGTRVAVTRVEYKDDRIEITVRTLGPHLAYVQAFEEQETFVEISPAPGTYSKGSPAPLPNPGPTYRREVKTVAAEKVRKRVTLATEAKFHFPWRKRDLAAADVPAVMDLLRPFLEPAREPLEKVGAAAAAAGSPEAEPSVVEGAASRRDAADVEVEPGMSMSEVEDVLGPPSRAVTYQKRTRWTYPDCVVVFEDGRVVEVRF